MENQCCACECNAMDNRRRNRVIFTTSWLNVAVNVFLAGIKITIGALTNSIAIVSEGINNATDLATSIITMVGTKLSQKRPTKKHPFGYGRIEYMTSLLIGILILMTGIEVLKSSIELLRNPEELKVSKWSLVILVISLIVKLGIGIYSIVQGKKVKSKALVALGEESRSDSLVSGVTIASAVVFLCAGISVDAWAGLVTSIFILKAAWDVLKDTVAALLGEPVDKDLADKLYALIRSTEHVVNAVDMTLHNYGPDAYMGSVNIELDHKLTVGQVYAVIHALQLKIMHEYHVTMVFGMYAVDKDNERMHAIRNTIVQYVRNKEHVQSVHALYLDSETNEFYCDFIVDYDLKDWDDVRGDFLGYMKEKYPDYSVILTLETEYV